MGWVSRRVICLVPLFCLFVSPQRSSAQGFGKIKRKVTLQRSLPPVAHLTGSFSLTATAHDPRYKEVAQRLVDLLEADLLQHNNQLISDKIRPDYTIVCTVVSYSMPPPTRVMKTNYTAKGPVQQPYQEVNGSMVVSFTAKASKTGRVLDSDNVSVRYSAEYDASGNKTTKNVEDAIKVPWHAIKGKKDEAQAEPKTPEEEQQLLVTQAANEVASRLVKTNENVEVLLARGKLDDQNKLGEAGLWDRMLEPLETMTPLASKEDDAYRFYNIGVAYEALAYKAEDPKAAHKFLDSAAINYGKAIDRNPGEKYFLDPQNRIQTALAHYKKLEGQGQQSASAPAPAPVRQVSASREVPDAAPAKADGDSGTLTNEGVIALFKAGMDQPNLLAAIRQAPKVDFDFSVNGQLELVKSGINGPVLSAMRARASGKK